MVSGVNNKIKENKMNLNPKRLHTETFKQYKERLKINSKKLKQYLKGRFVWVSCMLREYTDGNGEKIIKQYEVQGNYKRRKNAWE